MKTLLKPAILLVGAALFASTAASEVSDISSDNLVQYGKEEAYWVANVTCSDESNGLFSVRPMATNGAAKPLMVFAT